MKGVTNRAVLEIKNLSKSYGEKKIIEDVNIEVMQGEFLAIVGESGSGKSTLLNIVGLLDSADSGSVVRVFGRPAPRPGSRDARLLLRNKLAYIFQNAALVDQDSVEDNLILAQHYSRLPKKKRAVHRKSVLAQVGLGGREKQRVFQLSGGEQQRLAIACMQMHASELILADEPTGSLDPVNRDAVMSLLVGLSQKEKTLIVVTHDPLVASMADRVIEIPKR